MAGTVYRSPAPGEPHFVKEGDKVTKGQTICIIEAMKLMNEIEVRKNLDLYLAFCNMNWTEFVYTAGDAKADIEKANGEQNAFTSSLMFLLKST